MQNGIKVGAQKGGKEMAEGQGAGRQPELGVILGRSGFGLGQTKEGREKRARGMGEQVVTRKIIPQGWRCYWGSEKFFR